MMLSTTKILFALGLALVLFVHQGYSAPSGLGGRQEDAGPDVDVAPGDVDFPSFGGGGRGGGGFIQRILDILRNLIGMGGDSDGNGGGGIGGFFSRKAQRIMEIITQLMNSFRGGGSDSGPDGAGGGIGSLLGNVFNRRGSFRGRGRGEGSAGGGGRVSDEDLEKEVMKLVNQYGDKKPA